MNESDLKTIEILRALGNEHRWTIMTWLVSPREHFPEQVDGDLVNDGVCVGFITEKIGLRQPTVTNHLQILAAAGLVTSKRIKNWIFYRPNASTLETTLNILSNLSESVSR